MIGTKVFIRHALSPVNEIFRVRPLIGFRWHEVLFIRNCLFLAYIWWRMATGKSSSSSPDPPIQQCTVGALIEDEFVQEGQVEQQRSRHKFWLCMVGFKPLTTVWHIINTLATTGNRTNPNCTPCKQTKWSISGSYRSSSPLRTS